MFPPEFEKEAGKILQEYLQDVVEGIRKICTDTLLPVRGMLIKAIKQEKSIFAFGNGGSHSEADVFLYALERAVATKFKFHTVGAPPSGEILDTKNGCLFERTLARKGRKGDVAVLVSASGDSINILRASKLCKKIGIQTISLSANGRIANSLAAEPDYAVVIPMADQQKLEEVTLGALLVLVRQIASQLAGKEETIKETRESYLASLTAGVSGALTPVLLMQMVEDIILAFKSRGIVRIDATAGILKAPAKHMAHNLVWDARDETRERWSNLVLSGLPDCHMTGVGNDGGCGFNGAIELMDNGRKGDVEIVFAMAPEDIKTRTLVTAARNRGVSVHILYVGPENELAAPGIAQMAGHLTGRMTNTRLLLEQGVIEQSKAAEWMRKHDLALLRKKREIREGLQKAFRVR